MGFVIVVYAKGLCRDLSGLLDRSQLKDMVQYFPELMGDYLKHDPGLGQQPHFQPGHGAVGTLSARSQRYRSRQGTGPSGGFSSQKPRC